MRRHHQKREDRSAQKADDSPPHFLPPLVSRNDNASHSIQLTSFFISKNGSMLAEQEPALNGVVQLEVHHNNLSM
jgi:hypothetical protein